MMYKYVALNWFFDYITDYICELRYATCTRVNAVGTKVQFAFPVPVIVVRSRISREVTAFSRKQVPIESSFPQ